MKTSGTSIRDFRRVGKRALAAVLLAILLAAGTITVTARTKSSVVVRTGNSWSRARAPSDNDHQF